MYSFVVDNGMLDFAKADTKSFIGVNDRTFAYERISQLDKCYTEVFNPSENPGAYLTRPSQPGMYSLEYLNHYGIRHNTSPGASYQDAGFWAQNMFCAQKVRYLAKDCYWVRRDNEASSELDTSKLFTICDEFAFVYRRIGEIDGINKEACYRAISKFAASSYDWNLFRLKDEDRKPFIARYSKAFNVLASRNQIDWSLFDEYETNILKMIIEHPDAYYYRQFFFAKDFDDSYQVIQQQNATIDKLKQENAALRQELENVYQSKRYKIGSKIAHLGGR